MALPNGTIATVLAPAATSLGGAFLGAWLALRRFKHETRFEKRVEWYHDAVRRLAEASNEIQALADPPGQRAIGDPSEAWERVERAFIIRREARLYGGSDAAEIVEGFEEELSQVWDRKDALTNRQYFIEVSRVVSELATKLAEHGNRELGFGEASSFLKRIKERIRSN